MTYHTHSYWDGRTQTDEDCRREDCDGIARVTIFYAPDRLKNWVECEKCGERWV